MARILALHGVHVIMPVRNVEAGKKVKISICEKILNAKLDVIDIDKIINKEIPAKIVYEDDKTSLQNADLLDDGFDMSTMMFLVADLSGVSNKETTVGLPERELQTNNKSLRKSNEMVPN
nr:hypothetical protein [Tanacetum cinerariifolium]